MSQTYTESSMQIIINVVSILPLMNAAVLAVSSIGFFHENSQCIYHPSSNVVEEMEETQLCYVHVEW